MGIILTAENLAFRWDHTRDVFSTVTFMLHPGELFCILGPNGVGKSTLLKCLINLLDLHTGSVRLDGIDTRTMNRKDLSQKIAYVPQGYGVAFSYTILEYVLMGRAPYISAFSSPTDDDVKIAVEAIREAGVYHLMDKRVTEISGGEHQLAMIARALAQQPDILLLDEPTSHLDFGNQMQVLSLIERLSDRGITIIMTSHFPDHAFIVSDQVGIMREGVFSTIGPANSVITSNSLQETYNVDVAVEFHRVAGRNVCIPLRYCRNGPVKTESVLDTLVKENSNPVSVR